MILGFRFIVKKMKPSKLLLLRSKSNPLERLSFERVLLTLHLVHSTTSYDGSVTHYNYKSVNKENLTIIH